MFWAKDEFGERITHGMLESSMALTSVTAVLTGDCRKGIVLPVKNRYIYREPVLVGNTIKTKAEILEKVRHRRLGII